MIRKLRLKNKNINKYKLIKKGFIITLVTPFILTGCDLVNASDYYLVHEDSKYYICYKAGIYENCDDYQFKSILDNKVVGSICSKRENFDYETHHFSTNFLSELQIVSIKDLLNKDSISKSELLNISNDVKNIGDNYFKKVNYCFDSDFEYDQNTTLKLFYYNDKYILGYDISPKRLKNNCKYIFSISDIDVIKTEYDADIKTYEININDKSNKYITYDETLELLNSKKLENAIKK